MIQKVVFIFFLSISRWQEIPSNQDLEKEANDKIQSLFLVSPGKIGIQGSEYAVMLVPGERIVLKIDFISIISFLINLARLQLVKTIVKCWNEIYSLLKRHLEK